HGQNDALIAPAEAHATFQALASTQKSLKILPGVGHNDLMYAPVYWKTVGDFIAEATRAGRQSGRGEAILSGWRRAKPRRRGSRGAAIRWPRRPGSRSIGRRRVRSWRRRASCACARTTSILTSDRPATSTWLRSKRPESCAIVCAIAARGT